jgi:hypothetical protein
LKDEQFKNKELMGHLQNIDLKMLKLKSELPQDQNLYKVKVMLKAAVSDLQHNYS